MSTRTGALIPMLLVALLAPAVPSTASTLTLDALTRGWYSSDGNSNLAYYDNNYLAGDNLQAALEFRHWFEFDLTSLSGVVTGARLLLDTETGINAFRSDTGTETYTAFDVSASSRALLGTNSVPVFNDLGSGGIYGSWNLTFADNGTHVSIALNALALSDINAALGSLFATGGAVTSLNGVTDDEFVFGSTIGDARKTRLELQLQDPTPVPEPGSLLLLGTGVLGMLAMARRQRDVRRRKD